MKTVFEGVINGEKFDTVEAYNAKIQELMADPRNTFEAHTSTRLVADSADQNGENRQAPETKDDPQPMTEQVVEEDSILATPGFNDEDEHYLDYLIRGVETDLTRLADARQDCEKTLKALESAVRDADTSALMDLAGDYRDILKELESDYLATNTAIEKVTANLKLLKKAPGIIQMYQEFYRQYQAIVAKELDKRPAELAPHSKLLDLIERMIGRSLK